MTEVLRALPDPVAPSWEAVLADAVRPEFRVAVYWAGDDDSVLGRPLCRVRGCGEAQRGATGLCQLHLNRWHEEAEPDLDAFAATQVGQSRRGRIDKCLVEPCPRSCQALRLCTLHLGRWRTAGKPEQQQWAAGQDAGPVRDRQCLVTGCEFPATGGQNSLCDAHAVRFTNSPFDDPNVFVLTENGPRRRVPYDMRALTGMSRLEMQFVLQQRHDEQGATLSKTLFDRLVATVAAVGGSLLDGDETQWLHRLGDRQPPGFLRYARNRLALLRDGAEMDWDDDTWDLRRALGVKWDVYSGRRLRFGDIPQPWLRDLAKRWARLRLASRAQCVVYNNVRHVALLGQFLQREGVERPQGLTRDHLEGFLAWLRATPYKENSQAGIVASVRTFLDDCATHAWDTRLPRNARLFPGEGARFRTGLPRFISEDVMCQLEDPANMTRWDDPTARNLFVVMRETGKRAGEVVRLGRDPVLLDSTGAPCLLYHDYKGRRDAIVPISDLAAAAIRDQQRVVAQEHPTAQWLFPRPGRNADGSRHYTTGTFNERLNRWMRACEINDAAGNPVTVSSHQFRHTMATRMLNLGVPQHIVQQMLGHARADTVATYARLSDRTLRREFERYQQERVNIRGEVVTYSDTSPTAEAEWIKHRISKALQTLPNGECGRPIQQACPHPNACLTCDDFLTDRRHLDSHRDQLDRTRKLIAAAESSGNVRMVEMNHQVEVNLARIITTIESRSEEVAPDAAS